MAEPIMRYKQEKKQLNSDAKSIDERNSNPLKSVSVARSQIRIHSDCEKPLHNLATPYVIFTMRWKEICLLGKYASTYTEEKPKTFWLNTAPKDFESLMRNKYVTTNEQLSKHFLSIPCRSLLFVLGY